MHAFEVRELSRVSALIHNAADDGEEQAGENAVGKHLEHCAGEADLVERHQAEEHESHMAYAGITDDEFEVLLHQGHKSAIDNADHSQNGEYVAPGADAEEGKSPRVETVR